MKKFLVFISTIFMAISMSACGNNKNDKYISVSKAIEIANQVGEKGTEDRRLIKGVISSITNTNYGEMYITDSEKEIHIYGLYSSDGTKSYADMENKPYKGDEIYVSAIISMFKGNPDLGKAWLIDYKSNQEEADLSKYTSMSIAEARNAEEGKKVIVEGVVGYVTYASGMNPNGIYLIDDKASIYIYGVELAGRVKIGNKVKIAATKTYYILDTEKENAAKYGYKGSIQLQDAILVSNDNKTNDIPLSWAKESTIKDIIDTPFTNNITTDIFKVHGYIHKVPGVGFTNYYIDDLDDKTGSYCYSLCNGGDFAYLDKYDGKICLIYLSPLNCKATSSSAYYRFIPVAVEEETYVFNESYAPEFAIKYYVNEQFADMYKSDPSLEVMTSFNNETFKLENVQISYLSNKESALNFINENGKLIMHTYQVVEDVEVTLKATYLTYSYEMKRTIKVNYVAVPTDALNVKQAIESADNSEITVHGIVASSLVNQTGFYLVDETGIIAVRMSAEELSNIQLGNEIYIKGNRTHFKKEGSENIGQSVIDDAKVVVNLYGENEYSKESFIADKTFDELLAYKDKYATTDYSATAFITKGYLIKVESSHTTNYYISNKAEYEKESSFYLYAGSGSQYNDFSVFLDKGEVTIEFALCDWNSKSEYRACLISVYNDNERVINHHNFH